MNKTINSRITLASLLVLAMVLACSAENLPAASTPVPTTTKIKSATNTQEVKVSPTALPDLEETKQVDDFLTLMKQYYKGDKDISTMEPEYYLIKDYEHSVAGTATFEYALTDINATDFIITVHIKMETANEAAPLTGCGIMLGSGSRGVVLQQNGETYVLTGTKKSETQFYGNRKENPTEMDVTLLVIGDQITWYVEDKLLTDIHNQGFGRIGYVVLSGSSYDFGSRCSFTNTRLWVIK